MSFDTLQALSPLDGRYHSRVSSLQPFFSEAALIRYRVKIEALYLEYLSKYGVVRSFSKAEIIFLRQLSNLNESDLEQVKKYEREINHDVKAVEYFIRQQLAETSLKDIRSFIHIALTSEDVNNLAYRLMIQEGVREAVFPELYTVLEKLLQFAEATVTLPMLARTHGQPAIPTTLGKELAIFCKRLCTKLTTLHSVKLSGKLNGAVGGYQAMVIAAPSVDWLQLSQEMVEELGLTWNELTTQVNPADDIVELLSYFHQLNSILLDLNQDIWRYISDEWLVQVGKEKEVGSSTMPQKVNPIEFENSEGNLVVANALLEGFNRKLPVSRLQRDLSDSTVMRNVGSCFGYCLLAYTSLQKGLQKLAPNPEKMLTALESNYSILLEALQVSLRATGDTEAYEKAMAAGKGKVLTVEDWHHLTKNAPAAVRDLTPTTYLGLSVPIAQKILKKCTKDLHVMSRKDSHGHD